MIAVLEPLCCGLEHVPVNTAMVQIVAAAFAPEAITVSAEPTHLTELQRLYGPDREMQVRWQPIAPPGRQAPFRDRLRIEAPLLANALCGSGGRRPRLLVLLAAAPSTIFVLKWLRATGRLQVPAQVILHGGAAELAGWRSRNPLVRMQDLATALALPPRRGLQYVVLDDDILSALQRSQPGGAAHTVAIPHPILPSEVHEPILWDGRPPLKIAFLGLASASKGFNVFLELARRMHRRLNGRVEFHAIGSLPTGAAPVSLDGLSTIPSSVKLPREAYLERLRQMHYVCLPYQGHRYELTASGVLLDAIANSKPILACPTPMVQKLFRDATPGQICRSLGDFERAITARTAGDDWPHYDIETAAITRYRDERLPGSLMPTYRRHTLGLGVSEREHARSDA